MFQLFPQTSTFFIDCLFLKIHTQTNKCQWFLKGKGVKLNVCIFTGLQEKDRSCKEGIFEGSGSLSCVSGI